MDRRNFLDRIGSSESEGRALRERDEDERMGSEDSSEEEPVADELERDEDGCGRRSEMLTRTSDQPARGEAKDETYPVAGLG